jgi:hypothetical protein
MDFASGDKPGHEACLTKTRVNETLPDLGVLAEADAPPGTTPIRKDNVKI